MSNVGKRMSAGRSASHTCDTEDQILKNLSGVFPQVDIDVLRAVLHQEGSYEAAVEALLLSVVSHYSFADEKALEKDALPCLPQ